MLNMSKIQNFLKQNSNHHIFFLLILSINYLFPLLLFGKITLFYHDALDIEIVYNKVIGQIYKDGFDASKIFLAGEVKATFLRRLFQPYMGVYAFFNAEVAYWLIDVSVKLTSYFSMYLLAKKLNKNLIFCSLTACLFASINLPTHEGFGIAIFPYLIYLILFKTHLKFKNYLVIFFFGLNSDIVRVILSAFTLPVILFIIDKDKTYERIKDSLKILFIFFIAVIISNSNLLYVQFFEGPFHREEFYRPPYTIIENLKISIFNFFELPNKLDWTFFYKLPFFVFFTPIIIFSLLTRNIKVYKFFLLLITIYFFLFFLKLDFVTDIRYNSDGFIGSFGWGYIFTIIPFIQSLILIHLITKDNSKSNFLFASTLIAIILLQLNSSSVPIIKKYFLDLGKEYKNIYTFDGYYSYEEYKEIKRIVKNKRIISIGLDPMVAVMNDIKTIDGYHTLYPLSYKNKFKEIIKDEINHSSEIKNYFNNWGSRVYAFISDPKNIKINFSAAKKNGANYVLSKYPLNSKLLSLICVECKTKLFLYEIKNN